jgi:hypothetical protein
MGYILGNVCMSRGNGRTRGGGTKQECKVPESKLRSEGGMSRACELDSNTRHHVIFSRELDGPALSPHAAGADRASDSP